MAHIRTLITGGAGFLGSHLVDRCIARGDHVVVLDNLVSGNLQNLEAALRSGRATFIFCDVANSADFIRAKIYESSSEPFNEIFHLASPASPDTYSARPWETLLVNGPGTMSLIEIALADGAKLLFSSTSEVYGDPLVHPQPESYFGNVNPIGPRACYDEGKRFGEAAVSVAIRERGLNGRVVRIFNCYGPRMEIGDGRLIPSLFQAARDDQPFPVHGSGLQTRSMTYVSDLVDGLIVVQDSVMTELVPVNLGSEEELTVNEIAATFAEIIGSDKRTVLSPARPEDPQRRRPVTTHARSLGWSPKVSLREGLQLSFDWFKREVLEFV